MKERKFISKSEFGSVDYSKKGLTFSRSQLCIPYALFLGLFIILPLVLIIFYAFTSKTGTFTLENFTDFFTNRTSLSTLFVSFLISGVTTIICLVIGYPIAYILSKIKASKRTILLLLFIMPMWINFVLRAMAMKELMTLTGIFAKSDFYNFVNTIIGMVYDYLPFMILPLYSTLIKQDQSLLEASFDLGATKKQTFLKITLPLSLPGILSGITMVFLPSLSAYVISDTFGNGKISIIGKLIEEQFGTGANWNAGSAIAIIMLVIMFVTMLLSGEFKTDKTERRNVI